jgi:hypothetical protein
VEYLTLSAANLESLARDRVQALEADHYRSQLLLAEAGTDEERTAITAQLRELERRIRVHAGGPEVASGALDGESVPPNDPDRAHPVDVRNNGRSANSSGTDGRGAPTNRDHSLDHAAG